MMLNWHPVYSVSDYVADHQELLEVIAASDPGAGEVVRAHLTLTVELIVGEATRYASRVASTESIVHNDDHHNEGSLG
jgi:hypothetical protein